MEDRSKMIYGNEIGRKAYRNAIHSKKKFIKKCAEAGISGLIIPDLPFEENEEIH